jgi:hypothetical protein
MANPGPASATTIHPQSLGSNQALRLLAYYPQVSLAALGDAAVMPIINSSNYNATVIITANATKDIAAAEIGIFTGPATTGTTVLTDGALSSQTTTTYVKSQAAASVTASLTAQNLYVNVSAVIADGAVDVFVYGYDFSTF